MPRGRPDVSSPGFVPYMGVVITAWVLKSTAPCISFIRVQTLYFVVCRNSIVYILLYILRCALLLVRSRAT